MREKTHFLTVVLPTFNRRDVLRKTVEGYFQQSAPDMVHELLIVDDGSTDNTQSMVEGLQRSAPFKIRYFFQLNQGPAAARNLAIKNVTTPLVLLTDDDMIPHRDLVARHAEWHRLYPEHSTAVLGHVEWAPDLHPTPFMKWYGEAGPLFAYGHFKDKKELDFRYFYSCNLSLKSHFLQSFGGFDQAFKMAAYEDTELGFRLTKHGLRLVYSPLAIAYHYQHFSFASACRKTKLAASTKNMFLKTEAGKRFLQLRRGRDSRAILSVLRHLVAWVCLPAVGLLDSPMRLPRVVYRSLFWYYTRDDPFAKETVAPNASRA